MKIETGKSGVNSWFGTTGHHRGKHLMRLATQ